MTDANRSLAGFIFGIANKLGEPYRPLRRRRIDCEVGWREGSLASCAAAHIRLLLECRNDLTAVAGQTDATDNSINLEQEQARGTLL